MTRKSSIEFTREQNVAEVDQLLSDPPRGLVTWLKDEGLELADAKEMAWGALSSRLKSDGILDAAQDWKRASQRELLKRDVSQRMKVLTQLALRFMDARMRRSAEFVRPMRTTDSQDYSFLPDYLQWVVQHPGLRATRDTRVGCCETCKRPFYDPVQNAVVDRYERDNPAPNDIALNRYEHCLGDDKYRQELFKEVDKLCLAERNRKATEKTLAVENEKTAEEVAAEERLLDLDAELAEMATGDVE